MTNIANTTIGNDWDTELVRKLGHRVDSSRLRTTYGHDLLSDTNGTRAHANTETIGTCSDKACRLLARDDIAGDDLQLGVRLLDPLDHLNLEDGVPLGRIYHDDIETSFDEQRKTFPIRRTRAYSSSRIQLLALRALRCERVGFVLEQVGTSEEGDKATVLVDNRQLALFGVAEDVVRLLESDTLRCGDEVGGHDLGEGCRRGTELNVAVGNDTNKLAAEAAVIYA